MSDAETFDGEELWQRFEEAKRKRAMNNELVELVLQLYEKNWGVKDYELARAVVAMCMEEAAKVAESYEPRCDACPSGVAAAIRALKDKA